MIPLWAWAVEGHGRPGVEALCLRLQDDHGQCVSYLIWAAWADHRGCALSEAEIADAAAMARDWEAKITGPLRSVRRALKSQDHGVAPTARAALRQRVQAEELAAERLLLEALEARTLAARADSTAPATTLIAAAAAWDPPAPRDLLEALGHAFSKP